ncbi:BamA/TamA family outer membrane protein [Pedobacter punctiformis]|uniref:Metallophosphoesterase n=1 Tax=Pedobacter punctiformis TaxID=3004097 RepID=A0ABT4LCS7_9SPHI|nr:BamA/TamA family outer membrane protein [Pedobacter sp. HCMS5-2]MCZ4245722.1 metallophosphoesterase [Pedobacter sp. HCMS5-2]
MIKKFTLITTLLLLNLMAFAQKEVKYRVILFGDAGEMNSGQTQDLKNAAKQIIPQKTTVLYLGDNIYPTGMGLPGSVEEEDTKKILRSQFEPMRTMGAAVYFIPGNHDWDKSGPKGLAKIKAQGDFLQAQNDPLLKLIPQNGCPDPVAINLTDRLTVIAYDSEWWLFPYKKQNTDTECDCNTKDEILIRMEELLEQNKGKVILLASHHPFQSYGPHGGYFNLRNHIFPLTALNHNLYIPMPGVGSLYPILRSTLLSPEDLNHPAYKDMIKSVTDVFGDYPNVTYVAGHEHGLQLIKSKQLQIVSGSGSKISPNKKGKNSLFHEMKQGYVVADQLMNNDMRYEYYVYADTGVQRVYSYTKPFEKTTLKERNKEKPITADSIMVSIKPEYDSVGRFHRFLFGENYRKEYAAKTKMPVIRISEIAGGLKATKRGGGNQSRSLRLEDKNGKEWVLRSVEKYPEVLLPAQLRETFAKDIIQDNMSAQNPFSALVVPDLAKAAGIPHSTPKIGWVSPDDNLGEFAPAFANTVCLLEEREPLGDSDNSAKMYKKLNEDNDNTFDGPAWLKARAFDVLLGDWDRHDDQWRWKDTQKEGGKHYIPVPRDRDQVFFMSDGFIQRYTQSSSLLPMMQGYERNIKNINWFLWEGRELSSRWTANIDEQEWNKIINEFCAYYTDEIFENALKKLPAPAYSLHHDKILAELKERRATLPKMMNDYYHFFNRIVDIEVSDKNELVQINDTKDKGLAVKINKISKEGNIKGELFNRVFDPKVTKELRVYLHDGNDSLILNNKTSSIKIRIIGGKGNKVYDFEKSNGTVKLYDKKNKTVFKGDDASKITKTLSNDTANVSYIAKDMYRRNSVLLNAGYNSDDGLLLGLIYKQTNPGFRKTPYGNSQTISFLHSFQTAAFKFDYKGEWLKAVGKADFILKGSANAPNNTQNFFGLGNETYFDSHGDDIRYYRSRFNLYQIDASLRWRRPKSTLSIGPSYQYYKFNKDGNEGRFIKNTAQLHSADSLTIENEKMFAGAVVNFTNNTRDNDLLPTLGSYIDFKLLAYKGVNKNSNSFGQFTASIALYKNLDGRKNFILADRVGGGLTFGKPAFYQAQFLGGQGNLLGFRQYRFAGDHSFYNNLELRAKLGDLVSYVLPGQVGLLGFYDVGRVWKRNDVSDVWHHGVGGGVYFAPASLTVFRFVMGHSSDGWYPYISMNFRY